MDHHSDESVARLALTVVATKPRSPLAFVGQLIRILEGIGYSHVSFFFDDQRLQRRIGYETALGGADFISEEAFFRKNIKVKTWTILVTEDELLDLYRYLWDIEGTKYGKLQIIGLSIKRVAKMFGKKIKNPFSDGTTTQVCLETIGRSLEKISKVKAQNWDELGLTEIDELLKPFEDIAKG